MEVKEVKVQQVDERCPICGKGWMRPTGVSLTSSSHEHKCTNCDYKQSYPLRYPYIIG